MTQRVDEDKIPVLYSAEAEESLIGGVLIREEIPEEVKKYDVIPRDFWVIRNQWVWNACQELDRFKNLNIVTVADYLLERKQLIEIRGTARLTSCVSRCWDSYDIEQDAQLIKEFSQRRLALKIANRLAQVVYTLNKPFDLNDIITKLYKAYIKD